MLYNHKTLLKPSNNHHIIRNNLQVSFPLSGQLLFLEGKKKKRKLTFATHLIFTSIDFSKLLTQYKGQDDEAALPITPPGG